MAFAIGDRFIGCAAHVNRVQHLAIPGVDDGSVDLDCLDWSERLAVPHGDRLSPGESVARLCVNHCAIGPRIWDLST